MQPAVSTRMPLVLASVDQLVCGQDGVELKQIDQSGDGLEGRCQQTRPRHYKWSTHERQSEAYGSVGVFYFFNSFCPF